MEHPRMTREKKTIEAMVRIYCKGHHGTNGLPCAGCGELLAYAKMRLDRCRYQEHKPTCGNCPAHCYKPSMKGKIMDVMRYSGPRMTYRHPVYALYHFLDSFRKAPAAPIRGKKQASRI